MTLLQFEVKINIFYEQTWYNISLHSEHEVLLKVLQGQYLALVEKYKQKDEKTSYNFDNIVFHIASLPLNRFLSNLANCATNCRKYYLYRLRTVNSTDIYIPPAVPFPQYYY